MPEFVIERTVAGLGAQSAFGKEQAVRRSCSALHGVSPGIAWLRSYVTADKVFCVYRAPSAQAIRDEIARWDLDQPDAISEVRHIFSPDDEHPDEEREG